MQSYGISKLQYNNRIEKEKNKKDKEKKLKNGTALFFNYIEGCKNDVINLKKRLENLDWKCIDLKINSIKDFKEQKNNIIFSGPTMVFFFGYGYGDQIFLGSSTKESVSYEVLCEMMSKLRKERDDEIVVFTSTCFKKPVKETYEYVKLKRSLEEISHFCIKINGTCQEGSLMTHILLNEIKEDLPIYKLAMIINGKMDNIEKWNEDEYCHFLFTSHGNTKTVIIPSLTKF